MVATNTEAFAVNIQKRDTTELIRQHEERLAQYSLEERRKIADSLFGSLSVLADQDIQKNKSEALLR